MDEARYNRLGGDRIGTRQVDELIGLARAFVADGVLNDAEVECLRTWLAANVGVNDQPLIRDLYARVAEALRDGFLDDQERAELLDTLRSLTGAPSELGEALKPTDLPLCRPAPALTFPGRRYCFTGTFLFGRRRDCEGAVATLGATAGGLTQRTDVLVIGAYVTESWRHSSFGAKIAQAWAWRDAGAPIAIVTEDHWREHL